MDSSDEEWTTEHGEDEPVEDEPVEDEDCEEDEDEDYESVTSESVDRTIGGDTEVGSVPETVSSSSGPSGPSGPSDSSDSWKTVEESEGFVGSETEGPCKFCKAISEEDTCKEGNCLNPWKQNQKIIDFIDEDPDNFWKSLTLGLGFPEKYYIFHRKTYMRINKLLELDCLTFDELDRISNLFAVHLKIYYCKNHIIYCRHFKPNDGNNTYNITRRNILSKEIDGDEVSMILHDNKFSLIKQI